MKVRTRAELVDIERDAVGDLTPRPCTTAVSVYDPYLRPMIEPFIFVRPETCSKDRVVSYELRPMTGSQKLRPLLPETPKESQKREVWNP